MFFLNNLLNLLLSVSFLKNIRGEEMQVISYFNENGENIQKIVEQLLLDYIFKINSSKEERL